MDIKGAVEGTASVESLPHAGAAEVTPTGSGPAGGSQAGAVPPAAAKAKAPVPAPKPPKTVKAPQPVTTAAVKAPKLSVCRADVEVHIIGVPVIQLWRGAPYDLSQKVAPGLTLAAVTNPDWFQPVNPAKE